MAAFALAWAVLESVVGPHLRGSYDVTEIVWWRYATHLLLVFAVWGRRGAAPVWRTARPGLHVGRSLLMLVMPVSYGLALRAGGDGATVWSFMWTAPAMALVLAHAALGERPAPLQTAAAVGGAAGAALVLRPGAAPPAAVAWAVLMAASFALYVVCTRVLRGERLATNLFYTAAGVFVALSAWMPRVWVTPPARDVAVLAAIGAVGFVALWALDRAVGGAPVPVTAPAIHLQVVFSVLVALARPPHAAPRHALAGALLVTGLVFGCWWHAGAPRAAGWRLLRGRARPTGPA
jgi:drug/metabolite transporter (DMT)-like permease